MKDAVNFALGYPYATPSFAYQFTAQGADRLTSMPDLHGRHPIVGIGSNRAPAQLARKFADWPAPLAIPVMPARLRGYDVVYSAHIAAYGAVPATLHAQPGVTADVAVLWLTAQERERMDATEALGLNYARVKLPPGSVESADIDIGDALETYASLHGPAQFDGQPWAVAAVSADNRALPARDQKAVQEYLRRRTAPRQDFDAFVLAATQNRRTRKQRAVALQPDTRAPAPKRANGVGMNP